MTEQLTLTNEQIKTEVFLDDFIFYNIKMSKFNKTYAYFHNHYFYF